MAEEYTLGYIIKRVFCRMPSDLPDIEEKVKVWAWNMFLKTRSKEYSKLKYEDVALTVNWSKVKFISSTPEYFDERKLDTPNSQVVFRLVFEQVVIIFFIFYFYFF